LRKRTRNDRPAKENPRIGQAVLSLRPEKGVLKIVPSAEKKDE
jgi:hypothetical protein